MPITIRRATIADARAIAEVKMIGWETTYGPLIPREILDPLLDIDAQTSYQRGLFERPDTISLLALDSANQPIGIAVSFVQHHGTPSAPLHAPSADQPQTSGEPEPYLESLHVLPEHRSTGVGELLMREIAAAWQARGHTTLTLWVLEGNKRAQAFYTRLGGTLTGTQQVNWAHDSVNEHFIRWGNLTALANPAKTLQPPPS